MDTPKNVTISDLVDAANLELLRMDYGDKAIDQHSRQFREFSEFCERNEVQYYEPGIGAVYFQHRYGLDIADCECEFTNRQKSTRSSIRFLDDIYQFGYARQRCGLRYNLPVEYTAVMEEYLAYCVQNKGSDGTVRVKRTKLQHFLSYLFKHGIPLPEVTPATLSDFMITQSGYARSTIHVTSSVLKCFFLYLEEKGIVQPGVASSVPMPKIYVEESIPETWTPEEVKQLLNVVERTSAIGKRDYAMILLAVILGMRVGDICALTFKNFDWNRRLIVYTQQKTHKVNTLPILPEIGEAIIDYLKNGRLDSDSDTVFIRHIHPYGPFQSSSALSLTIKRYMRYAGIPTKERKAAHALRHTLASTLLYDGTPLMTISNILGHYNMQTTMGYTKVNITSLRKCPLSYGIKEATE